MVDKDFLVPRIDLSALRPRPVVLPESMTNPAQWAYERIVKSIVAFEEKLDTEHEIGARLVSFGSGEIIYIDDVGYWGPDIIIFYGANVENQPVELLQHISQISVLLVAVKKQAENARRIGFKLSQGLERSTPG